VIAEVRDRHLVWMGALAKSIRADEGTRSAGAAFRRDCGEVDNMPVAVAHALASDQRVAANEIVADSWRCSLVRPTLEARRWFDPTDGTPPWTGAAAEVVGLRG
jgi:hypothetical protein